MNLKENIEQIIGKLDMDLHAKLNTYFDEDMETVDVVGAELVEYLVENVKYENIGEIESILIDLNLNVFWERIKDTLENKVEAYASAKQLRDMDMNGFLKITKYVFEEFILYDGDEIPIDGYTVDELMDMANVLNTIQIKYLTEFKKEEILIARLYEIFGLEEDRVVAVLQLIKSNRENLLEKFYIENLMYMRREIEKCKRNS